MVCLYLENPAQTFQYFLIVSGIKRHSFLYFVILPNISVVNIIKEQIKLTFLMAVIIFVFNKKYPGNRLLQ